MHREKPGLRSPLRETIIQGPSSRSSSKRCVFDRSRSVLAATANPSTRGDQRHVHGRRPARSGDKGKHISYGHRGRHHQPPCCRRLPKEGFAAPVPDESRRLAITSFERFHIHGKRLCSSRPRIPRPDVMARLFHESRGLPEPDTARQGRLLDPGLSRAR